MLRAILFDFNGVLVDDEPLHLELFQQVLAEEDIPLTAEDYFTRYIGFDDRACFQEAFRDAGRPLQEQSLLRLIARKAAYYQARIRSEGFPIFPGAVELIREAAAAELMLGVVSGALRDEIEGALRQMELSDAFKVLVAAEDVGASKPDPEGYRRALDLLNAMPPLPLRLLHPHEVLAIEDTPAGLEAAAAAGLSTLGVAHTYPAHRLQAAAGHLVTALDGLALADLLPRFT